MKKTLLSLCLALPVAAIADSYTGNISTISMNEDGSHVVFELVDHTNTNCISSWFVSVAKSAPLHAR